MKNYYSITKTNNSNERVKGLRSTYPSKNVYNTCDKFLSVPQRTYTMHMTSSSVSFLSVAFTPVCCETIFVHCKQVLLSLADKEPTSLQLGMKRLGRRIRLGECWEKDGWSLRSCKPDTEEKRCLQNEVTSHEPCSRTQIRNMG